MPKTVILSAARTPIGKLGGGLASLDATELGATAIKAFGRYTPVRAEGLCGHEPRRRSERAPHQRRV